MTELGLGYRQPGPDPPSWPLQVAVASRHLPPSQDSAGPDMQKRPARLLLQSQVRPQTEKTQQPDRVPLWTCDADITG